MGKSPALKHAETPFEQFHEAMKKLLSVPKAELNKRLEAHATQKPKRRAGRKPTRRKAD
jgi:hypothetical protein